MVKGEKGLLQLVIFGRGGALGARRRLLHEETPGDLSLARGRGPSPLCMQL